jgi:transcriptional antiterminator RfaH
LSEAIGEGTFMPLLPLEPFVFPGDLLSGQTAGSDDLLRWWVLHTRPRAEKALARRVLNQKISFFLPLYKRQWRSKGRLLSSHVPLFPGYVFLRGDGHARQKALETNLVANCLPVNDQLRLWSDLTRVYSLMASGSPLSPEDRLQPGTHVEIVSGPLAGIQGKIIRRGKHLKFFVEVEFLRQGVSVEIESWMFRPMDAPKSKETDR